MAQWKRALAAMQTLVLVSMLLAPVSSAASTVAVEDHWAGAIMEEWTSRGLLQGYQDGSSKPEGAITRAEFVKLLDSVFRFQQKGDFNFRDVEEGDWYYEAVMEAAYAGVIQGSDGLFRPDELITRQEAAVVLARAFRLSEENSRAAAALKDGTDISDWAVGAVSALYEGDYVQGREDHRFEPASPISRAESVVLIHRVMGELIDRPGVYSGHTSGNVTVNVPGVILKDRVIDGSIYLTPGIGAGEVSLANMTVKGDTIIQGGRVDLGGSFAKVVVEALHTQMQIRGSIATLQIEGKGASLNLNENTVVHHLIADAPAIVTGKGKIVEALIHSDQVQLEMKPEKSTYGANAAAPSPTPSITPTPASTPSTASQSTPEPTAPMAEPSPSPSVAPTTQPSPSPSAAPTTEPSPSPSAAPTVQPSPSPSVAPTAEPSPSPSAAPILSGLELAPGSYIGTAKAIAMPSGQLRYRIGSPGLTPPALHDPAASYTTPLALNKDIGAAAGQHIYVAAVDNLERIIGWKDVEVMSNQINLTTLAQPVLTQALLDQAVSQPLVFFNNGNNSGWNNLECTSSNAFYYLTLAAHLNESTASTDGVLAKDKALGHIRNLISGGKEPNANGGLLWSHGVIAQAFLLAKHTPVIWDALTEVEKSKVDLLMKTLAIAGNWCFDDENFFLTGLDQLGNFEKTWNPNHRNPYATAIIAASLYFGAEQLNTIFLTFNYDDYMQQFTDYGFTNVKENWAKAGKELMENGGTDLQGGHGVGVRTAFTYQETPLSDSFGIFHKLTLYTFGAVSSNTGANGLAYIISGASSPYLGQQGMMTEFDAGDAAGPRSDAAYCYDSVMVMLPARLNLELLGIWGNGPEEQQLESLMNVGMGDFIFKVEQGYHGYANGAAHDDHEYERVGPKGYWYDKDIWFKVLKRSATPTTIAEKPSVELPDPVEAPANSWESAKITNTPFSQESYRSLGGTYTGLFSTAFDLTFNNLVDNNFNGVLGYTDSAGAADDYVDLSMLIQFTGGTINVRNGTAYVKSSLQVRANGSYHFRLEADLIHKTYSVWATPVSPVQGAEVQIANQFSFRTGALPMDHVGMLVLVTESGPASFWVQNTVVNGQAVQTPSQSVDPVNLTASADATLRGGGNSGSNYGTAQTLEIKDDTNASNSRKFILQFDTAGITSASSVTLMVYNIYKPNPAVNVYVFGTGSGWEESGVNWGNAPVESVGILGYAQVDSANQWVQFNVTDYVSSQIASGQSIVSFMLECTGKENIWLAFNSREAAANKPLLKVIP
ncbi:MAG: hypothetical protein K0R57_230 [Paenibacillaceae bacterium]|jgi:hypothetical protein|nr:hypothetical protein [Paenibacillaceae bacterium]